MSDITVRVLAEEDWGDYRDARLRALAESPEAFSADHEQESAHGEDRWRERMTRATRLVADRGGDVVGVVSVGTADLYDGAAELFGLWVAPAARGAGVANHLVDSAGRVAVAQGRRQLVLWVGVDNGPAVAHASGYGFRPTEHRRPMRRAGAAAEGEPDEELAMVLALRA